MMDDIQKENAQPYTTQDYFNPIMPITQNLGQGWFPPQDCMLPTTKISTPNPCQSSIEPLVVEDL